MRRHSLRLQKLPEMLALSDVLSVAGSRRSRVQPRKKSRFRYVVFEVLQPVKELKSIGFMERSMGIELSAIPQAPLNPLALHFLGDLIWAGKRGILRSSCAQIFPIAQIFGHRRVPFSFPLSARAASNIARWQSLGTRAANSSHVSLDLRSRLSPTRQETDGPSLIALSRCHDSELRCAFLLGLA